MWVCKYCETINENDNSVFCSCCGNEKQMLQKPQQREQETAYAQPKSERTTPVSQSPDVAKQSKANPSWFMICLIVFSVLLIIVAIKACDKETPASVSSVPPSPVINSVSTVGVTPKIAQAATSLNNKTPSKDDILEVGENIIYPQTNSYLSSYETMYVKSEKGHSVYVYYAPKASEENRRSYFAYEGDAVTVLARENGLSCVLFPDAYGKIHVGWVTSKRLVYIYD